MATSTKPIRTVGKHDYADLSLTGDARVARRSAAIKIQMRMVVRKMSVRFPNCHHAVCEPQS